ncbi:MAG: hypothetical protein ACI97A_004130 [Planctomycetota bacterium]|jgi:hypothetical protein
MDLYEDPFKIVQHLIKVVRSPMLARVLGSLRGYHLVFVITAAAIITGGSWAVKKKLPPIYRAEAKLFVAPSPPRVLFANEEWHKESIAGFYEGHVWALAQRTGCRMALIPRKLFSISRHDSKWYESAKLISCGLQWKTMTY